LVIYPRWQPFQIIVLHKASTSSIIIYHPKAHIHDFLSSNKQQLFYIFSL
jgi:hypothetical protein